MLCSRCGFDNEEGAKFCLKCGNSLNNNNTNLRNENSFSKPYNSPQSKNNNNNILIIGITAIIIALIIAGTVILLSDNTENLPLSPENVQDSQANTMTTKELKVNTASFYLDGNPNTGVTTTLNVGKEHSGETVGVMTTFSRDGVNMNNPTEYESCVVDEEGDIVFTDYTPIPKYPDYCIIGISYNNQRFEFGCDMEKHKGTQTQVPQVYS